MKKIVKNYKFVVFALFTCLISPKIHAYLGAVTTGTAGSGRATVEPTEAPFLNPAAIAFLNGYFFTTSYTTQTGTNSYLVSLTDNMADTSLPSSVIYSQMNKKIETTRDWTQQNIRFSTANFISGTLAGGLTINHQIDSYLNEKFTQTNLGFGMLYTLNSQLGLAAVFENMMEPDIKIPGNARFFPSTSLGLNYNFKRFMRTKIDIETPVSSNSWEKPNLSFGIESYWNRWLIMRIGMRKENETKDDFYSGGVGFIGPKFAFHYAYITCPQDDKLTRHAVDLAVPIW